MCDFVSLNDIWKASLDDLKAVVGDMDMQLRPEAIEKARKLSINADEIRIQYHLKGLYRLKALEIYKQSKQLDYLTYYFVTFESGAISDNAAKNLSQILDKVEFGYNGYYRGGELDMIEIIMGD